MTPPTAAEKLDAIGRKIQVSSLWLILLGLAVGIAIFGGIIGLIIGLPLAYYAGKRMRRVFKDNEETA